MCRAGELEPGDHVDPGSRIEDPTWAAMRLSPAIVGRIVRVIPRPR